PVARSVRSRSLPAPALEGISIDRNELPIGYWLFVVARFLLPPRLEPLRFIREMRRLSALLSAILLLSAWSSTLPAQEAVSSTSTSGPSTSAASSSTTTTDLSTGTTAPSAAVTNSSGAASTVQTGPSGPGIFPPTPVTL